MTLVKLITVYQQEFSTVINLVKKRLKRLFEPEFPLIDEAPDIRIYPSQKSCVKHNMSQVRPEQMPPLMVRKAAWRRENGL